MQEQNHLPSNLGLALSGLSQDQLDAVLSELEELRFSRIALYSPFPKQIKFHTAGLTYRERLLRAGNQLGKTYAGAAEMAYHLTGDYPSWWAGRRWDRPIKAWMGGKDSVSVRDAAALLLLGGPGDRGTGLIPKSSIVDITASRGIADGVDNVIVRHVSGGLSRLTFKTYDQGRERWQGATLDVVWFDEEPGEDVYLEGLTRTNATGGMVYMTFTPLLGQSNVVMRFLKEQSLDRHDTVMTLADATHLSEEQKKVIFDSYPAHELEARTNGTPILGEGRVFTVPEGEITVPIADFKPPPYWPQLGAMDLGWTHPFAAVHIYLDPDADCIYVAKCYRAKQETPIMHVAAVKSWGGAWLPWAWPHDALNETSAGGGIALKTQYESHGLNMLGNRASYSNQSTSVEAGLMDMLDRMHTGRLKVVSSCTDWFEEYREYHRKDGKVVKERDDLMSATRYGVMMIRHALLPPALRSENRKKHQSLLGADPLSEF